MGSMPLSHRHGLETKKADFATTPLPFRWRRNRGLPSNMGLLGQDLVDGPPDH